MRKEKTIYNSPRQWRESITYKLRDSYFVMKTPPTFQMDNRMKKCHQPHRFRGESSCILRDDSFAPQPQAKKLRKARETRVQGGMKKKYI